MVYSMGEIDVIHFEPPTNTSQWLFKIGGGFFLFDYEEIDNEFPFMLQWKYRFLNINDGKEVGGSYLVETHFSVTNDGTPHNMEEFENLILSLDANVKIRWQELVVNTSLANNRLSSLEDDAIEHLYERIQELV